MNNLGVDFRSNHCCWQISSGEDFSHRWWCGWSQCHRYCTKHGQYVARSSPFLVITLSFPLRVRSDVSVSSSPLLICLPIFPPLAIPRSSEIKTFDSSFSGCGGSSLRHTSNGQRTSSIDGRRIFGIEFQSKRESRRYRRRN